MLAESYLNEAAEQGGTTLRLAVSALGGHLSRYEPLPALMADHDDIEELVAHPEDQRLRQRANIYLKSINDLLKSSDIYIMTLDGETIAASNYDGPTSFIGQNFSYRPYFQDAAKGLQSRFFALGTTSHKRGYYFASPILFNDVIKGVIVFKVDIEGIEASFGTGENRIVVTDPEGIIFMTGVPQWLYSAILPLTPDRIARTKASRRYADARLSQLPVTEGIFGSHRLMTIREGQQDREYLVLSQPMPEAGWTVNVLMDTGSVRTQVQTTMLAALLCFGLAGALLAAMLQRRRRLQDRLVHQAEAQAELERRVEERRPGAGQPRHQAGDCRTPPDGKAAAQNPEGSDPGRQACSPWPDVGCPFPRVQPATCRCQDLCRKCVTADRTRARRGGELQSLPHLSPDRQDGLNQQTPAQLCPQAQ